MIVYSLQTGSVFEEAIKYQPRSCFILTQLGGKLSPQLKAIRKQLKAELTTRNINEIDAHSLVTGRDFLDKIWRQILSVPMGIAILCKDMKATTVANIFYELSLLDSLGKETLVIKTKDFEIPSDFVRTEYLPYGRGWASKLNQFFNNVFEQEKYYKKMADLTDDPILSIDYLRRAFLISGNREYLSNAKNHFEKNKNFINRYNQFQIRNFLRS